MTTAGNRMPSATEPVDRAIVAFAAVALCLSIALHDWVQAATVSLLLVVAVAKLRDPEAAWLTWMPLSRG